MGGQPYISAFIKLSNIQEPNVNSQNELHQIKEEVQKRFYKDIKIYQI